MNSSILNLPFLISSCTNRKDKKSKKRRRIRTQDSSGSESDDKPLRGKGKESDSDAKEVSSVSRLKIRVPSSCSYFICMDIQ